jgi:hypothetical protein
MVRFLNDKMSNARKKIREIPPGGEAGHLPLVGYVPWGTINTDCIRVTLEQAREYGQYFTGWEDDCYIVPGHGPLPVGVSHALSPDWSGGISSFDNDDDIWEDCSDIESSFDEDEPPSTWEDFPEPSSWEDTEQIAQVVEHISSTCIGEVVSDPVSMDTPSIKMDGISGVITPAESVKYLQMYDVLDDAVVTHSGYEPFVQQMVLEGKTFFIGSLLPVSFWETQKRLRDPRNYTDSLYQCGESERLLPTSILLRVLQGLEIFPESIFRNRPWPIIPCKWDDLHKVCRLSRRQFFSMLRKRTSPEYMGHIYPWVRNPCCVSKHRKRESDV